MDFTGKSKAELTDQLISLASSLKEEDLKDPATYGMVTQLVNILDPQAAPLPKEIVEKLQLISDPRQRLMEAALSTGTQGIEELNRLVDSMKAAGLMKAEDIEEALDKVSPKEIQKSHILMFPVSIRGQTKPPGDHASYHTTLKWLGNKSEEEDHSKIQEIVDRHQLHAPENIKVTPDKWETSRGPVHVLKLSHPNIKSHEYAHHELSEDVPSMHKYSPHITVSKELHDEVKAKGLTAQDLNIKIHPLEYRVGDQTVKRYTPAPQATEQVYKKMKMAKAEDMANSKKVLALLRKANKTELADKLEKTLAALEKGEDEFGNGIRGRSKRYQQAKVFGKPSDVKTKVKADGTKVHSYKIPDANGARTSPQRMKMMNTIKDYAAKKMGANMVVAEGKRDESGKLKNKAPIEKEPFDVFSSKGHKEEKARQAKIDTKNSKMKTGQKPIKRVDPKPDHRSGNLETQPSPDAAVHEIAHEHLAPVGMSMADHQTHMDKQWGESQSKHGHMQQKKTKGEIQPMAAENPIRREMGLPANRTAQKVKDAKKPVENTVDNSGPRFNRGKDSKGRPADYMRQSRLLHPETRERIEKLRDGRLKHTPNGIAEGTSVDAKINARAAAKAKEAPKANVQVSAPKEAPKQNHINQKPSKLAASEMGDGMSFNDLKKMQPPKPASTTPSRQDPTSLKANKPKPAPQAPGAPKPPKA